jgi:L-rhamnose mutarotase
MMSTVKPDRASFEKSSKFDRMKETDYADRLANSGTDSDGRNTWGDKTGYSDEEMAQGKGKLKKYPDKDGRNVWGDKVDYSDVEKKAKGLNEAKITKKEFDEIASAEQKAMEKKWDSLVTNIALSKSDPKKFTANMEAKQEYLTTLNKAGKLKKDYTADKIENWSTHDNLPGWKVANIVLTTPKSTTEGSCGYGPDGVPGDTPGGTKGMNADDRTRGMLRVLIQKEVAKLNEVESKPGDLDRGLEDLLGKDDLQKATNPKLAKLINTASIAIDPNMSYKEFAKGVAQVLIDDYGVHNYEPFIKERKNALDSTLG